jgi:phosphatidylserine/phosphatidylglycerophosphate/cardiolipin synthase-like enzyme
MQKKTQKILKKILLTTFLLSFTSSSLALTTQFTQNSTYEVCFTPKEKCTQKIADNITHAKQEILVEAYSFTSKPIANALSKAKSNGVDVKIIMDKDQVKENNWMTSILQKKKIPIFTNYELKGLAHNKIMIIDKTKIITGSFNFTKAAQKYNLENVLIIEDAGLAEKYREEWLKQFQNSKAM